MNFLPADQLTDEILKFFPNGIELNEQNIQHLIDNIGIEKVLFNLNVTGKFLVNDETHYYLDGQLHREDGPAVITSYSKEWYLNDRRHRDSAPAVEKMSGAKIYYQHGLIHRDDGPAVIVGGIEAYYKNGIMVD